MYSDFSNKQISSARFFSRVKAVLISSMLVSAIMVSGCAVVVPLEMDSSGRSIPHSSAPYRQSATLDTNQRAAQETNRLRPLARLFGSKTTEILSEMKTLPPGQIEKIVRCEMDYVQGKLAANEAIARIYDALSGQPRVVSAASGLVTRDLSGNRARILGQRAVIAHTRKLAFDELPDSIRYNPKLGQLEWGAGLVAGTPVLFPWTYTSQDSEQFVLSGHENTSDNTVRVATAP